MVLGKRSLRLCLCVVVLWCGVSALGCGGPTAAGPGVAPDPGLEGPYAVGVTTLRMEDKARETDGKPRPMVFEVWYPAVASARDGAKDVYNPTTDAPESTQAVMKTLDEPIPLLEQNAYRDAEPLRSDGPYPIILYSHGSGGIRFQSVFQCAHMASHGYIVVSADHEGNTLYNALEGRSVRDPSTLLGSAKDRPKDLRFMWNELKRQNDDASARFYQMSQLDNVGVTGHSFGGLTSILAAREFAAELKVSIPQTPATGDILGLLSIRAEHLAKVPFMVQASENDLTLPYDEQQRGFYQTLIQGEYHKSERHLLTLKKGGHFTYSNICDFDPAQLAPRLGFEKPEGLVNDGCSPNNIPPADAHKWINYYAMALFNAILRKSPESRAYLKASGNAGVVYESTPAP